jgi:hypothetical protein
MLFGFVFDVFLSGRGFSEFFHRCPLLLFRYATFPHICTIGPLSVNLPNLIIKNLRNPKNDHKIFEIVSKDV